MRWNLSELSNYRVHARDGSLGMVSNIYFDDGEWVVRYLGVSGEAGQAEPPKYLLAPEVIRRADREFGVLSVFLRMAAVYDSPAVATARNISRQEERRLCKYYGWPKYWSARSAPSQDAQTPTGGKPRLRCLTDVLGYRICADEEDIGSLVDLIIDDRTWKIHCLEVDASHWLPASRIWIRSDCIARIRGTKQQIAVTISRSAAMNSPKPDLQVLCALGDSSAQPGDTPYLAPLPNHVAAVAL